MITVNVTRPAPQTVTAGVTSNPRTVVASSVDGIPHILFGTTPKNVGEATTLPEGTIWATYTP